MKGIVDADSLEQQITDAFGSYMKGAVSSYAGAVGTAVERQITSAMEQVMNQMGRRTAVFCRTGNDTDRKQSAKCYACR